MLAAAVGVKRQLCWAHKEGSPPPPAAAAVMRRLQRALSRPRDGADKQPGATRKPTAPSAAADGQSSKQVRKGQPSVSTDRDGRPLVKRVTPNILRTTTAPPSQARAAPPEPDMDASPRFGAGSSWAIAATGGTHASPAPHSSGAASPLSQASLSSSAGGGPPAAASPTASGHFAGWEAEEQLSAHWGSEGSSFSSHSGSGSHVYSPPQRQPWLGGLPSPGAGGGSVGESSRPGSPGNAAGSEYMQYTVRSDSILGAPAGYMAVPEGSSAGARTLPLGTGLLAGPAAASSPDSSPASNCAQHQAAAWEPPRYPLLYGSQGWAPGSLEAAEQQGSEGSQGELEHEPSAPPLPDDEPWAGDDDHQGSAAAAAAAAGSPVPGGSPAQPSLAGGAAHDATLSAPHGGWGAAGAVGTAMAADWRWSSESSVGAPLVAGVHPSRQVSEETGRYQALLETLAARRREALSPAPAAGGAGSGAAPGPYPTKQALHPAADSLPLCSISGGSEEWPESPLPQAQDATQSLSSSAARPAAGSGSPARAKWSGVQTLLTNLSKSAEGWRERTPAAGLSFWDQPLTEEEEAVGAPCSSGSNEGRKGSVGAACPSSPAVVQPAVLARPEGLQPTSPAAHRPCASSPTGSSPSASPPSPAARLLSRAWQLVGGSPSASSADGCTSPPRGLTAKFAPLREWTVEGGTVGWGCSWVNGPDELTKLNLAAGEGAKRFSPSL